MGRTPNDDLADAMDPNNPAHVTYEVNMEGQSYCNHAAPTSPKDHGMFFDAPLIAGTRDEDTRERRPTPKGE